MKAGEAVGEGGEEKFPGFQYKSFIYIYLETHKKLDNEGLKLYYLRCSGDRRPYLKSSGHLRSRDDEQDYWN